jgi:hypothetical protein
MVEKEKTRVKGGKEGEVPLRIKLDRALKESEAQDEKLTNDGGVPTLTNQASTLQKYVQPSSEFSKRDFQSLVALSRRKTPARILETLLRKVRISTEAIMGVSNSPSIHPNSVPLS